jgi:hypothetical protein
LHFAFQNFVGFQPDSEQLLHAAKRTPPATTLKSNTSGSGGGSGILVKILLAVAVLIGAFYIVSSYLPPRLGLIGGTAVRHSERVHTDDDVPAPKVDAATVTRISTLEQRLESLESAHSEARAAADSRISQLESKIKQLAAELAAKSVHAAPTAPGPAQPPVPVDASSYVSGVL